MDVLTIGFMAKRKPPMKTAAAPSRTGKAVNAWVDPALYAALQKYLDEQRPRPTMTSVVEVCLEDFLREKGYWPPADAQADD